MVNRRHFLATLGTTALGSQVAIGARRGSSTKKGWCGADPAMHKKFGTHWYYNWTPNKGGIDKEFVPMIKGGWNVNERDFAKIKSYSGITHLLGYNEPERKSQGNLELDKALELWPKLVKLAEEKKLKLGSPAPSSDGAGMAYLDAFMKQAKRRKLRVDFVAVHWYRSRDPGAFESFVKGLARSYRKPIWITEFNGWAGTEKENYKFLRSVLKFMERSRDVERYAYFNYFGKDSPVALIDKEGELTRLGKLYRDAGT